MLQLEICVFVVKYFSYLCLHIMQVSWIITCDVYHRNVLPRKPVFKKLKRRMLLLGRKSKRHRQERPIRVVRHPITESLVKYKFFFVSNSVSIELSYEILQLFGHNSLALCLIYSFFTFMARIWILLNAISILLLLSIHI